MLMEEITEAGNVLFHTIFRRFYFIVSHLTDTKMGAEVIEGEKIFECHLEFLKMDREGCRSKDANGNKIGRVITVARLT